MGYGLCGSATGQDSSAVYSFYEIAVCSLQITDCSAEQSADKAAVAKEGPLRCQALVLTAPRIRAWHP